MTIGVLPFNVLKANLLANTGFFETSQTTIDNAWKITAGNFDGAGMSQGPIQVNFDYADPLSLILRNVYTNHKVTWDKVFTGYPTEAQALYDAVFVKTQAEKIAWADTISLVTGDPNTDKRQLVPTWKTIMEKFGMEQNYRDEYEKIVNTDYFPRAYDLFRQLPCTSRMSLASIYDMSVNRGRFYPVNALMYDFDNIDADTTLTEAQKEAEKIYQINHRTNGFENAIGDPTVYDDRRYAMANQGGNYFGLTYDPDVQFDMNQEPAIAEKVGKKFKWGNVDVSKLYAGTFEVKKVYKGIDLVMAERSDYRPTTVPQTQFRTNQGSYLGIGGATSVTLEEGQPLWVDVQNWIACRTYYTTDGTTPTTASPKYTGQLTFNASCTLKTLTVSLGGVAEAVKTLTVTIPVEVVGWRYVQIAFPDLASLNPYEINVLAGTVQQQLSSTITATQAPLYGTLPSIINGDTVGTGAYWENLATPVTTTIDLGEAHTDLTALEIYYAYSHARPTVKFSKDNVAWTDATWNSDVGNMKKFNIPTP